MAVLHFSSLADPRSRIISEAGTTSSYTIDMLESSLSIHPYIICRRVILLYLTSQNRPVLLSAVVLTEIAMCNTLQTPPVMSQNGSFTILWGCLTVREHLKARKLVPKVDGDMQRLWRHVLVVTLGLSRTRFSESRDVSLVPRHKR
jgi:hypothetical protein